MLHQHGKQVVDAPGRVLRAEVKLSWLSKWFTENEDGVSVSIHHYLGRDGSQQINKDWLTEQKSTA